MKQAFFLAAASLMTLAATAQSKSASPLKVGQAKAWVDAMPGPGSKSTLHVQTKVNVTGANRGRQLIFTKRSPQGINPRICLMDYSFTNNKILMPNPQEVKATEILTDAKAYDQIELYYEGKRLRVIKPITVVH